MSAVTSKLQGQPATRIATAAMSADSECVVTNDGDVLRVVGGRALMDAHLVIAAAVLEHAVWLVTRDEDGHTLHRFHPSGMPAAPPTALGMLGDGVTIVVNRIGARVALLEGDRAVLVREREGRLTIEPLGERRHDRRVLVGARGVAERSGTTLRLRSGALPPLAIPSDLRSYAIGMAAVVHDGHALLVELVGPELSTALIYDLRSGEAAKRIRLGELRVLAIAERAGLVALGRGAHVALLDLRAGRCVGERILPASAMGCAIDANGTKLVVVDVEGRVTNLGPAMTDLDAHEAAIVEPAPAEPEVEASPEPAVETRPEPVVEASPEPAVVEPEPGAVEHAIVDEALRALGEPPLPGAIGGALLAGLLADARGWIEATCNTAIAIARGDAALLEAMRAAEHAASDAFARWSARGAPHVELARELGLSPLASSVLLLVAAPQIWGELAPTYRECAGDPTRPLVDELLLAQLLEADVALRSAIADQLDATAPLVRTGAIEIGPGLRPYAPLSAHPAIARRLAGAVLAVPSSACALGEVVGPRAAIAALVAALGPAREEPPRIVLRGRRGAGRRTLATAIARQAGRRVEIVDAAEVETLRSRLQGVALRGALPCLDLDNLADDARQRVRAIVDAHAGPLFVRAPRDGELPIAAGHELAELPELDETARCAVWTSQLVARGLASGEVAAAIGEGLAARCNVGPGPILRACAKLANERAAGAKSQELEGALARTLRGFRSTTIAAVGERVDVLPSWDQLVVPCDIEDALHELVARVRHRRTVLETWGLARVTTTARAVTALFQGGPGTGKTMAAGVVAAALGYELWRIDLSKVTSKWIGETEKNLAAVFDAAEEGELVLLFDEADSLFARRTQGSSSGDRHGNVVTNYLLQRLDAFGGVAILTTNFGTAIDPAFRRRVSVQVQFPFPDEDERERLWRAHLPAGVPTSGNLQLGALARKYQLSGGYIRNAVMRAAYLAAARGGAITAEHLVRAVALEKERTGKLGDGRID